MAKVEFVHYGDQHVTYKHKGEWYKVPFFVLEDYSNDFFLEDWPNRENIPEGEGKAERLTNFLEGRCNDPYWNSSEPEFIDKKNMTVAEICEIEDKLEPRVIAFFKELFCDQLDKDFKAYQLYNYE